jgi:hypothetical protein
MNIFIYPCFELVDRRRRIGQAFVCPYWVCGSIHYWVHHLKVYSSFHEHSCGTNLERALGAESERERQLRHQRSKLQKRDPKDAQEANDQVPR